MNRIGNLTVTGYNSEYSNSTFEAKKSADGGFDDSPYRLNKRIKEASSWGEEEIGRRNAELAERALDYWSMIESDFEPKVEPLPTLPMGDDARFTNMTIVAYEFEGTSVTVASWKDMLKTLVRQLLADHREAIFTYAKDGTFGFALGETPGNTHQEEAVPGLWVSVNTSTNSKLLVLRRLFDHLELDTNDVVFTLRPTRTAEPEADEKPNKYEAVTKYIPQLEELSGTDVTQEDIEEISWPSSRRTTRRLNQRTFNRSLESESCLISRIRKGSSS